MGIIALYNKQVKYVNRHNYSKWIGLEDILIPDNREESFKINKSDMFGRFLSIYMPNVGYDQGKTVAKTLKVWKNDKYEVEVLTFNDYLCYMNLNSKEVWVKAVTEIDLCHTDIYPGVTFINDNTLTWESKISGLSSGFFKPVCKISGLLEKLVIHTEENGYVNIMNSTNNPVKLQIKSFNGDTQDITIKPEGFIDLRL